MLICSNSYLLVDHVVFCILVPFRRDIIKRKIFFFSGTDSLNTRNMDKLSVDYFMKICGADAMWNDSFWIIRYRCLMNLDTKNVQNKVFILYILVANRF